MLGLPPQGDAEQAVKQMKRERNGSAPHDAVAEADEVPSGIGEVRWVVGRLLAVTRAELADSVKRAQRFATIAPFTLTFNRNTCGSVSSTLTVPSTSNCDR